MSYKIRYGPDTRQEIETRRKESSIWLWVTAMVIVLAVGVIWPQGRDTLRQILCPWANGITAAAFQQMIQSIGSGTAVPAALADFCREIIEYAWIPV